MASVAEATDRAYSFVVVTTKALPDVLPTSKLVEPLLSSAYTHPQPTYVILQNGLGVEKDLHEALLTRDPTLKPRIITAAVWIMANLVDNAVKHNLNVSTVCLCGLPGS